MGRKQVRKFIWKIENFSSIKQEKLYSDTFDVNQWRVLMFPKGYKGLNAKDQLSIYLDVADSATLPHGWSRYAQIVVSVINQIDRKYSTSKAFDNEFSAKASDRGFPSFLPLSELHDPSRGYLFNDAILVEVDVSTDRTFDLRLHEFIVETDSARFIAPILEDITAPAVRPSSKSETNEPEDPTEREIETLFTSLESELLNYKIDYSREEAKDAIAKIEKALKMAPAKFYDETGKSCPLNKAFKVLSNSDYFSALTIVQKIEFLAMGKSFRELPERVVKAMQDKNLLSEKESKKLTLARDLKNSLSFFEEGKEKLKQIERKIAALNEQKMNILAGRKEKLKITKDMKMELETLGKEWPEYVAKAKAAEEEEKTVAAEWSRMKDFISSVKEVLIKGTN